jgi:hypothetical protein
MIITYAMMVIAVVVVAWGFFNPLVEYKKKVKRKIYEIKPLDWKHGLYDGHCSTKVGLLEYIAYERKDPADWNLMIVDRSIIVQSISCSSEKEAKEKAFKDFERRILPCLVETRPYWILRLIKY